MDSEWILGWAVLALFALLVIVSVQNHHLKCEAGYSSCE